MLQCEMLLIRLDQTKEGDAIRRRRKWKVLYVCAAAGQEFWIFGYTKPANRQATCLSGYGPWAIEKNMPHTNGHSFQMHCECKYLLALYCIALFDGHAFSTLWMLCIRNIWIKFVYTFGYRMGFLASRIIPNAPILRYSINIHVHTIHPRNSIAFLCLKC